MSEAVLIKQSDRRLTPELILAPVREFFGGRIPFDAFTEANNPTHAACYSSLEVPDLSACGCACDWDGADGLKASWHDYDGTWAQPPFSLMGPCVDKAIDEARLGAEILFLSRNDNRSRWHRRLADNADGRCNIGRSVAFLEVRADGTTVKLPGDFYAYVIWHFGRQRRRFERIFSPIGEVIYGRGPIEVLEATT